MSIAEAGHRRVEDGPTLESYFEAVRETSPFTRVRVSEASALDVDVPTVHAKEFDKLIARADQALKERRGIGVALMGSAGVGKSHLLSRLYRWANEPAEGGRTRACYVFLHNPLADPDRLPRFVLKSILSALTAGYGKPAHDSTLFRLVDEAVHHALRQANAGPGEMTMKGGGKAFRQLLGREGIDGDVCEVLFQFYHSAYPRQAADARRQYVAASAVTWLSGDEIDAEVAQTMGVDPRGEESVALRDDHQVEQVFLALCRLALVRRQPFVLCIDQVDNTGKDAIKALCSFLHAIIDHAPNLLVIVSGLKANLTEWAKDLISEAAWDRIGEYKIEVSHIKPDDGRKILEARLERFHEPFMELGAIKQRVLDDPLFPIGRPWFADQVGDALALRPREMLTLARDAWEGQQARLAKLGPERWLRGWPLPIRPDRPVQPTREPTPEEIAEAIDMEVDRKIEEQIAQHRLHQGALPPDAGNLTGLVTALLEQCRGPGLPYTFRDVARMKSKGKKLPPYDLEILEHREEDGRAMRTGLAFVTSMGRSATEALKRLLQCDPEPDHRLLVTDQERRPLTVGPQGLEYYNELKKLGEHAFQHVKLTFEQYAALDALECIVKLARVGDLEVEVPRGQSRPISEADVVDSHHRRDRYRKHPLLHHLLTEEPPIVVGRDVIKPLQEPDVRQYIVAQLAWKMGSTAHALTKGYLEVMPAPKADPDVAWVQVKEIVGRMHQEGLVHAQPHDDDLYMILGK